jgi:hypothetical protein
VEIVVGREGQGRDEGVHARRMTSSREQRLMSDIVARVGFTTGSKTTF